MALPCLPPEVPDSLRNADLENVSPHNLQEYFCVDKDTKSSTLSGSTLKCRKPLSKQEQLFVFPHVLIADSREEAKKAIRSNPELLLEAEEALSASLCVGMDEPWAEHEALMVVTLADVSGLPREVASAALIQSDYDMVSALMLTDEYRENGMDSCRGWERMGEVPSDFQSALIHVNPSLRRLSPTWWRVLHECQQRSQSQDSAVDSNGSVLCGRYMWSDSEEDEVVTVIVKAPAGLKKRDIVSTLSSTQWTLKVKGEEECLINGLLWGVVMPDESFWTIDQNSIVMTLQKREHSGRWEQLIQGELQLKHDTLAKARVLLAREEDSRLEAVLAAMEKCGSALNQLGSEGVPSTSGLQAPQWCCPSLMTASLLCRAEGRGEVNFRCVQWVGSDERPRCCVGWPLDSLEEGQTVVATL